MFESLRSLEPIESEFPLRTARCFTACPPPRHSLNHSLTRHSTKVSSYATQQPLHLEPPTACSATHSNARIRPVGARPAFSDIVLAGDESNPRAGEGGSVWTLCCMERQGTPACGDHHPTTRCVLLLTGASRRQLGGTYTAVQTAQMDISSAQGSTDTLAIQLGARLFELAR